MKKSTVFIVLVLIAVMLGVTAVVSADSKETHYANIKVALENLYGALDRGDKAAAEKAVMSVSTAVYNGMRYLASVNEYDSRAMEIINNANLALTKDNFDYYLAQANYFNCAVFGPNVCGGPVTVVVGTAHS